VAGPLGLGGAESDEGIEVPRSMRFVPIKNEAQLDLQALHRVRDRWIRSRTAVINQLRGFLLEQVLPSLRAPLIANRKREGTEALNPTPSEAARIKKRE
jgi:transposase